MKKSSKQSSIDPTAISRNSNAPGGKASGPKTAAGKQRVRYNALRHGYYSKRLIIQENEKAEFEELRKNLQAELEPETTMQIIAFERLLGAIWRAKQALQMEERAVKLQASYELEEEKKDDDSANVVEPPRWYTSGRAALNTSTKMLGNLRTQLAQDGGSHLEDHRDWIVNTLGNEFYDSLSQWRLENISAIQASEFLAKHSERYKMPLPESVVPTEPKVVVDPRARWDMMVKLVDVKLQDLAEIYRLLGGDNSDRSSAERRTAVLDVAARYITSAFRELERAFDWYMKVRESGR
jgi:hypothetical protein